MRLVVTGGGTGGHIYPAVAVAKEMVHLLPRASVLYVGTEVGMESRLVPKEGLPFKAVRSSGVMGKSPSQAVKGLVRASLGVLDALAILREFRPDVVLGTGGYASGPVMAASFLLGIPRAIQEQNAVPGKTNLWLSRISHRTFAAWDYSVRFFPARSRVVVTGNPVRRDIFEDAPKRDCRKFFGMSEEGPAVLLLGGSRGARTLVEAGIEIARKMPPEWSMLFVTGAEYFPEACRSLGVSPSDGIDGIRAGNIILKPYVYEMARAYGAADLVIGRAGGMTLAEITALGLPAVIVPSPNVAGNHQEFNARALEEEGAALVVREGPGAASRIAETALGLLGDPKRLARLSGESRRVGKREATAVICRHLIDLAGRKG
ncbi:MAG TPA: undecaprenyldiphospho-muramoylpentapeptide beta-N-acetylglucosaminyltransferase [Firmicutes bacterium]|nr:undecaprenyldiphospho-muramoylpentapeptide beta-N-acetylglucosaminyltransferase [Candidatus Fermentithermobacillaceae bacterium]